MVRDSKFWMLMAVFQVLFGLAVFAITRDHYMADANSGQPHAAILNPDAPAWPNTVSESSIARLTTSATGAAGSADPVELSRQADALFASKQYDKAAELYERLLAFNPGTADTHNNLGLTLHYLGRSSEALRRLEEGVEIEPRNQRIYLTIGYVNSQLGNTEQARKALTTATEVGTDESIRQSAINMLENLPQETLP